MYSLHETITIHYTPLGLTKNNLYDDTKNTVSKINYITILISKKLCV